MRGKGAVKVRAIPNDKKVTIRDFFVVNIVFAIKVIQPIIPSNLKKAKFIRAPLLLCLR